MARTKRHTNYADHHMTTKLDNLIEFEEFKESLLPAIRKDLLAGKSAAELMEKYQALAAARVISIAAAELDSGKALAAAKDIIDRTSGKAKESKEITHKLEKLSDEELDALVAAKQAELAADEDSD